MTALSVVGSVLSGVAQQALGNGVGAASIVLAGIEWDRASYPIQVTKTGDTWATDFDRSDYLPDSAFATTYYVDVATGNNANNGTTTGTKKKSIFSAITAGNATGQPYRVLITPGTYPRADGISNTGTVAPTQSCALIADGGRVVTGNFDVLSWPGSPDATYTNCYKVSRSNVAGVYDLANNDEYGDYDELVKVADAATCNTTPNSWAQVGSDLYVNREDAAAVTNANTRAQLLVDHFTLTSAFDNKTIYLSGIDMEGGFVGATWYLNTVDGVVAIADDCSFKYAGSFSTALDCVSFKDCTGLLVLRDCLFAKSSKDGVNAHYASGGDRHTFVLTERCTGRNFGKGASTSNNALTGHENLSMLDVDSLWTYGRGAVIRSIDDTRMGFFGSRVAFDLLDSTGDPPIIINAVNTSEFWLVDCEGEGALATDYVLNAYSGTTIYTRNFNKVLGQNIGNVVGF